MTNHQRKGSKSNAHVGREFEDVALQYWATQGLILTRAHALPLGIGNLKKSHKFDLGSNNPPVIVECKSQTWTESGKVPSAKLKNGNEAMFYFSLAPSEYRKIFFLLSHICSKRKISLADYYFHKHAHLVPHDVEIWELDLDSKLARRINTGESQCTK